MYVGTAKIHNRATGRIHVAWFSERPWPGGDNPGVIRWQSRMHHTDGAENEAEADQHMAELRTVLAVNGFSHAVDLGDAEWDGEGIPAMMLLGPNPPPTSTVSPLTVPASGMHGPAHG